MKTIKSLLVILTISSSILVACKKKKEKPIEECVYVKMMHKNFFDNIEWESVNLDPSDKSNYDTPPKSLSVPTGTWIRLVAAWNFDEYKDEDVEVTKIFIKTTSNGSEVECELVDDFNSNNKQKYFPAYANATYNIRFELSNGEKHTVGPFNVNVNSDSKTLSHLDFQSPSSSGATLLCTNNDADKVGFYYLFGPYSIYGYDNIATVFKADLNNSANQVFNSEFSPQFGLFAITREGLSNNQVKLVAADKIQSIGLYPELTSKYGCSLGFNYARFEPWAANLDTPAYTLQSAFENLVNGMTHANFDTITFSNPQPELIVSKANPGFKFITNSGKKGLAVLEYGDKACSIYFKMQR